MRFEDLIGNKWCITFVFQKRFLGLIRTADQYDYHLWYPIAIEFYEK